MTLGQVAVSLLLAVGVALSAPAASAAPGTIDGDTLVRIVNVDPSEEPVEVRIGDGLAQQLSFGSATSFVRLPTGSPVELRRRAVELTQNGPGCMNTVLVTSGPPDGGTVELAECDRSRFTASSSSVRFINASIDSGTSSLSTGGPAAGPPTAPFTAAARRTTAAGALVLTVRSPGGERLGSRQVEAVPDTAYTALWAGGGETPLRILWLEDGHQPNDPPPVDLPVDTDAPGLGAPPAASVLGGVALALAVVACAAVRALRQRVSAAWALLVLVLVAGCAGDGQPRAGDPPIPSAEPATTTVPAAQSNPPGDPVRLAVPGLQLEGPVMPVADDAGPTLPLQLSGSDVAWFNGTNRPGEPGVAAVAGHVSSGGRPAVFADLHRATAGDTVDVTDTSGESRTFTVVGLSTVPKAQLNPSLFVFTPEPRLLLLTCSGPVDPARRLRTQNLLVLAVADSAPEVVSG